MQTGLSAIWCKRRACVDCHLRPAPSPDARPAYNKTPARKLRKMGMDILVCTPEKLAECMAQIIRG